MTDIDAIRKTPRFGLVGVKGGLAGCKNGCLSSCGMVEQRDGPYVFSAAYDAKCEELARERGGWLETARQLEALAVKHDALRAERDAAVRERDGLREVLRIYGLHEACCAVERDEACDCGFDTQLAALAPPTEQPKREGDI